MFIQPLWFRGDLSAPAAVLSPCVPEGARVDHRTLSRSRASLHPTPSSSVPSTSFQSATRIERWSLANAIGVLVAAGGAGWVGRPWPLLLGGIGLLGGLVVVSRENWTPQGIFGAANGVTAFRAGLLALLPPAAAAGPGVLLGLSLLILATDGLDGWLARRGTLESEFGAFFDKETDALFLLTLCALAAFRGRLPVWILGVGLLRYGFVVFLFLAPTVEKTEERSTWARYVYGGTVTALLTSFLPYPTLYQPLVALAAGALVVSFVQSAWRVVDT